MVKATDKRTQQHENARPQPPAAGVGARQASTLPPPEGGGYLNTYRFCELENRDFEKKSDPRLRQLYEVGLSSTMLQIATEIGVDNFLKMWEILDKDESLWSDSGGLLVRIRRFRSWLRHERNRFIKDLASSGERDDCIKKRVATQFGDNLHSTSISRVKQSK